MPDPITTIVTTVAEHATTATAVYGATKHFLAKIFGPALDEVGEIGRDYVKGFRAKNAARTLAETEQLLASAGIEPQAVPLKTLLPLLDGASLEEDSALVAKWAALLANAADPAQRVSVQPGFVEVLRQFTPNDARIAEAVYFPGGPSQGAPVSGGLMPKELIQRFGLTYAEIGLSVDNLLRLRVCKAAPTYGDGDPAQAFTVPGTIMGTVFGLELMRACSPPVV